MNVWILQTGESLHVDNGNPRPMRAMNLSNALNDQGHDVVLWSSCFDHRKKTHRFKEFRSIKISNSLTLNLIPSPGYKNNISFMRMLDHGIMAFTLFRLLRSSKFVKPDICFVGYPPIATSFTMIHWLKRHQIPGILDVKYRWPEIFLNALPIWIKPAIRILLLPLNFMSIYCMRNATVHCSMTGNYLTWMNAKAKMNKVGIEVPLTTKQLKIGQRELKDAENWWISQGVNINNRKRFCFIGSISRVFDFQLIKLMAERFIEIDREVQFVICGTGNELDKVKRLFKNMPNVIFGGWIDVPRIKVLANCSSASISPYRNTDDFTDSIPNKILDSLSLGLPIITTLEGEVEKLLDMWRIGVFISHKDEVLKETSNTYNSLQSLIGDDNYFLQYKQNCINCYNNLFDFDKVYGNLILRMEEIATKNLPNVD